jgi:hypothetical protein
MHNVGRTMDESEDREPAQPGSEERVDELLRIGPHAG